jgi:hypothetical protein
MHSYGLENRSALCGAAWRVSHSAGAQRRFFDISVPLCRLLRFLEQIRVLFTASCELLDCRLFSTHQLLREVFVDATNRVRILEMPVQDVHCRLNARRDWQ